MYYENSYIYMYMYMYIMGVSLTLVFTWGRLSRGQTLHLNNNTPHMNNTPGEYKTAKFHQNGINDRASDMYTYNIHDCIHVCV